MLSATMPITAIMGATAGIRVHKPGRTALLLSDSAVVGTYNTNNSFVNVTYNPTKHID
jgi:hypothetical protein